MAPRALPRARLYAAVGALASLTYLPSLGNGFALDDVPAVAQDERIRSLASIPELLTAPYLTYLPAPRSPYRPVTSVTYALSWALGGGHPAAFHAFNVAAHAAATMLLLGLLLALGAVAGPAVAAASAFAVHPVHVEAVAGIVGRADVLAALACLSALRLYVADGVAATRRIGGMAVLYLLALGSKESAVVLPLLVVLVACLRPELADPSQGGAARVGLARRLFSTWPTHAALAVALALFLGARRAVLGGLVHLDVAAYVVALPTGARVTTAVANVAEVTRLLLFPADLSPEYGPELITPAGAADGRFWAGVALVGLALSACAWWARRGGAGWWGVAAVAWFTATFALLSNVLVPLPMWVAERTLYLPSVGVSLLLVGGLAALERRRRLTRIRPEAAEPSSARAGVAPASVVWVALAALCLLGSLHSWNRSQVWRDDETLMRDLASRHPESFRAQWWLGGRMVDGGDLEGGLVWLARAAASNPNSVLLVLDYARALLLAGRAPEAEGLVRPMRPELHPSRSVYLAQSLIVQGREREAAAAVHEGLALFPRDPRLLEQARALGR